MQRFEFDNYQITVEKLPEEEQPESTNFYCKTDFYGHYIFPVYLQFSEYATENGLKLKYGRYLDNVLSGIFYFKLEYELRKVCLYRRGYAYNWLFEFNCKHMGKFSDKFIYVLESGLMTWKDVTKLAQSKRFINSVIKECKTFLVAE